MAITPVSYKRLSHALLITCGVAAAVTAAEAVVTPALAQKEQFERTKPHLNIGTIGHQTQTPSGLATPDSQSTSPSCCDNMVVDGVRDVRRKPVGGIKRRQIRIRPKRR